jgi:hypothetical protein
VPVLGPDIAQDQGLLFPDTLEMVFVCNSLEMYRLERIGRSKSAGSCLFYKDGAEDNPNKAGLSVEAERAPLGFPPACNPIHPVITNVYARPVLV